MVCQPYRADSSVQKHPSDYPAPYWGQDLRPRRCEWSLAWHCTILETNYRDLPIWTECSQRERHATSFRNARTRSVLIESIEWPFDCHWIGQRGRVRSGRETLLTYSPILYVSHAYHTSQAWKADQLSFPNNELTFVLPAHIAHPPLRPRG